MPTSSVPYSLMQNPPDASGPSSWSSRFAHKVNVDLSRTQPGSGIEPAPHNRILENVNGTTFQPQHTNNRWQNKTTRCFIAVCLAAILVTAALIGAMIAIARNTKSGEDLDTSLVNESSSFASSQSDARTTLRTADSASVLWSLRTTISDRHPVDSFTTSRPSRSTVHSGGSQTASSFGSIIESTQSIQDQPSMTTTIDRPLLSATSSTNASYNFLTALLNINTQIAFTSTLDSLTATVSESASTTPATSSGLMQTITQPSRRPSSQELSRTSSLSDDNTTHYSNNSDTTMDAPPRLSSETPFSTRTPSAEDSEQEVPRGPTQRIHGPTAHEWLGDQGPRAPQRPGHDRHKDQHGLQ